MSYTVANRRREIGIRIALGATRGRIISRLVGEGLAVAATGAAAGAAGAALCGGLMSGLLFGVTRFDATAFLGAFAALMITAGMACYLPARRAARIEPQQELR
jgi:ABC-type antimicrobial peptide transport system permease subunit